MDVLQELRKLKDGNTPLIDQYFWRWPDALKNPDYYRIIERPLCFGLVMRRLTSDQYRSLNNFVADVRLVFDNAIKYYHDSNGRYLRECAAILRRQFDDRVRKSFLRPDEIALSPAAPSPDEHSTELRKGFVPLAEGSDVLVP